MSIPRFATRLAALSLLFGTALWPQPSAPRPRAADIGNLPLAFVSQGNRFSARGQGYLIGLDSGAATIQTLPRKIGDKERFLSLGFPGGQRVTAVAGRKLSGVVNYITGSDPQKWRIGLPTVGRVTYPEVYPGIDVVWYGNQRQLEFDLVVKPGADPRAIRMKLQGGGKLSINRDGALELADVDGLRIALPKIYQEVNGVRKSIAGHFSVRGNDEVAFAIESWDRTRPLVIDPAIVYSTWLDGDLGGSNGMGIAVDASGNVLVTGYTTADDFPDFHSLKSDSAYLFGYSDGFVSKLNSDGTALIYSTVFGGIGSETPRAIAVDSTGAAWVTGFTESEDFPLAEAAQPYDSGSFVLKVDTAGVPVFSTFIGRPIGSSTTTTWAYAVAVDPAGNGYVTGYEFGGFPVTSGVVGPSINGRHAFVSKYSPNGKVLYATLLGGSGQDFDLTDYGYGIAADVNGDAYVTGETASPNFVGAPAGGAQTTNRGNYDAFAAKLNSDGTALLYFTFLGGSGADQGTAIAVDASLNAYVTGYTRSAGLSTAGAAQTAPGGAVDSFVAKLNPAGNAFEYLTYLGGSRQDYARAIATDAQGNAYVAGGTESPDFPVVSPVQGTIEGNATSVFRSVDGGASWAPADTHLPGRVFDISLNPAGTSAVAVTESGIYRTTDGGSVWSQQLDTQTTVTTLSRSLAAPSTIYALYGLVAYRSTDDGITWSSITIPLASSAREIIADPLSAGTAYLRGASTFWRSTDGGSSWEQLTTPVQGSTAAMIGAPDGALYLAMESSRSLYTDIYKSTNQGTTWSSLNAGLPANSGYSPHQLSAAGNAVYFAMKSVYRTTDGGRKWTSAMGPEAIYELEASPKNPSVQYALGASGYVLKSTDGGATWNFTSLLLNSGGVTSTALSNSKIVVDPSDAAHVFAISAIDSAVFVAKLNSAGSALTWSTFLGGSSSVSVAGIATDGAGNAYIAGTADRSIFPSTIAPRSGTAAFVTKISEAAGDCKPFLNATDRIITGKSQTLKFGVLAPSGCGWTTSTDADWAAVTSGASRTGAGLVVVQVSENTGTTTRTATLKAGGSELKIIQAGNSCSYSLDTPPSSSVPGLYSYAVPSGGGNVTAVLTATGGCPWTVVNPYPSLVTVTSGSSGTGSGTIQLTVAPNILNASGEFFLPVATETIDIEQAKGSAQSQSITFSPIADQTLEFAPPPLSATASSHFPVTFASDTPSVCQVSGTTVTLIAAGTCSITANQPGNTLWLPAAPVTRTFAVTAAPAVPQPAGIVNAANGYAEPSTVAPGSYIAIYGQALAGHGDASATTLPLPSSLNGTQATLGGLSMPLLYAASGQINALVPMGLTPGQSYPLVITRDGIPSAPVSVHVQQFQPGIYTVNATGAGEGIVTNSLTGQLITKDNPATAGDFLTIYCNGLGPVHGPNGETGPADGAAAPLGVIYSTNATVTASVEVTVTIRDVQSIASMDVPVLFSGLTPSLAGLYQVNIRMPSLGAVFGPTTSVKITATGQTGQESSNAVSFYVH